ncbi:hypothetical protein AB5N19_13636 [Seiridium cardinale]
MDANNAIAPYTLEVQQHAHRSLPTFLTLPVELRWEIYTYLLRLLDPINVSGHSHPTDPKVYPHIISACRQTYFEAHPMLYRLNIFMAHQSLLTSFPRLRQNYSPVSSSEMASIIRRFKLRVRLDAAPGFTREEATQAFSGLEQVEIEVWQAEYRCAGREVLELFEDIRGVRKAKVSGSTSGFECYAKWLQSGMMKAAGTALGQKYEGEIGDMSAVSVF